MIDIATLRKQYAGKPLNRNGLKGSPFSQFDQWMQEALQSGVPEPNAMTLATVGREGMPDVRIVLLRGYDEEGFRFFTNYTSKKAVELGQSPKAALHFFWEPLHRQVRLRGTITRTSGEVSDTYFASRPREHQIGAWASDQSAAISSRSTLEEAVKYYTEKFDGSEIPRPDFWGGYQLIPTEVEFWQGRESRLHDRFLYRLEGEGWLIERLAP